MWRLIAGKCAETRKVIVQRRECCSELKGKKSWNQSKEGEVEEGTEDNEIQGWAGAVKR